jgi:hypothetical protein
MTRRRAARLPRWLRLGLFGPTRRCLRSQPAHRAPGGESANSWLRATFTPHSRLRRAPVISTSTPRHFAFLGTLAPFFRASDSPIAIPCLRLVTRFAASPALQRARLAAVHGRLDGLTGPSAVPPRHETLLPTSTRRLESTDHSRPRLHCGNVQCRCPRRSGRIGSDPQDRGRGPYGSSCRGAVGSPPTPDRLKLAGTPSARPEVPHVDLIPRSRGRPARVRIDNSGGDHRRALRQSDEWCRGPPGPGCGSRRFILRGASCGDQGTDNYQTTGRIPEAVDGAVAHRRRRRVTAQLDFPCPEPSEAESGPHAGCERHAAH